MSEPSGAWIPDEDHRWQVSIQYHHDIKEWNSELRDTPIILKFGPGPGTSILILGSVAVDLYPWIPGRSNKHFGKSIKIHIIIFVVVPLLLQMLFWLLPIALKLVPFQNQKIGHDSPFWLVLTSRMHHLNFSMVHNLEMFLQAGFLSLAQFLLNPCSF